MRASIYIGGQRELSGTDVLQIVCKDVGVVASWIIGGQVFLRYDLIRVQTFCSLDRSKRVEAAQDRLLCSCGLLPTSPYFR